MNKSDLTRAVMNKTGMNFEEADNAVEAVIRTLKGAIKKREPIIIRELFTINYKLYAAKKGQNISQGKTIDIPARHKATFYLSIKLAEAIR